MRKPKALQIKFTDVKPTEAGFYLYRKDKRLKRSDRINKAVLHQEGGKWYAVLDGVHEFQLDFLKGQFSQRIEVAK